LSNQRAVALCGENETGLVGSYARALRQIGWEVLCWDVYAAHARFTKFGRLGRYASSFVPVDAWTLKANRELILDVAAFAPSMVLVSGNAPVRVGALAQIRIQSPSTRIVLLWPDSLLNLSRHIVEALPAFDLVATYSRASIPELLRLGAPRVEWIPFAADPVLFPARLDISEAERRIYDADVSLVGNHRPEREKAVAALISAGLNVKVWGEPRSWARHARDKSMLRRYFQGHPLFGESFAKAVRCARLSLNPIDPTNHPSANMRFFESPACGGATLNSSCPEMAEEFPEAVAAFYYASAEELPSTVRRLLGDEPLRHSVAAEGHRRVIESHTYAQRAQRIADLLG
jgi:hypothetical protein